MIALDSSSLIAFLAGQKGSDVDAIELALEQKIGVLPPVVLTEILSDPKLSRDVQKLFMELPVLSIQEGFWERSGFLRSKIISKGQKARLADTLIAQTCIDHQVSLVTRDSDFKHYARQGGLKLFEV